MLAGVRTGILGGTFDPIHLAHLHAGETALYGAALDRVLFMPAGEPWQKGDRRLSAPEQRLEMTRLAIEGVVGFELDEREIHRDGPTYTIDTLLSFPPEEELFLILGTDAALGLPTWHRWEEVAGRASILIAPRPGFDGSGVLDIIPGARILDMAPLEVSSTRIRAMAGEGKPFQFLVTPPVYEYIVAKGLYTQAASSDMVEVAIEQEESQ